MPQIFQSLVRPVLAAMLTISISSAALVPVFAQDTPSGNSELATQLPAVDLPTMNSQGFVFELESSYEGKPSGPPADAPIYAMKQQITDADQAKAIAGKLGVEGDLKDEGNGTYSITGKGTLYVTPGLVQYVAPGETPEGGLSSDAEVIAAAREWLRGKELLPANAGEGTIQTKVDAPARAIVLFQPVTPTPLISSIPNVTVTVGAKGTVLEASWRWADVTQADTYQLRPLDQAFAEISSKRAYLQATLPSDKFPDGATIKGKAVYSSVSLAYASSGVPGEQQYLQPVYVFTGKLTPEGSDTAFSVTSYVPALANSNQPVG